MYIFVELHVQIHYRRNEKSFRIQPATGGLVNIGVKEKRLCIKIDL